MQLGMTLSQNSQDWGCSSVGEASPSLFKFNPQYYTHAKMKKSLLCVELLSKATPLLKPPLLGKPGLGTWGKRSSCFSLLPEINYYNLDGDYLSSTAVPITAVPNTAVPTLAPTPDFSNHLASRELTLLAPCLLCLPCRLLFHLVSVSLGVIYSEGLRFSLSLGPH